MNKIAIVKDVNILTGEVEEATYTIRKDRFKGLLELSEIKKSVPSLLKPFMRKHIKQIEDMQERKQTNKPEKIIKTYELSGEKEKE